VIQPAAYGRQAFWVTGFPSSDSEFILPAKSQDKDRTPNEGSRSRVRETLVIQWKPNSGDSAITGWIPRPVASIADSLSVHTIDVVIAVRIFCHHVGWSPRTIHERFFRESASIYFLGLPPRLSSCFDFARAIAVSGMVVAGRRSRSDQVGVLPGPLGGGGRRRISQSVCTSSRLVRSLLPGRCL